jgi:hypothetical protein
MKSRHVVLVALLSAAIVSGFAQSIGGSPTNAAMAAAGVPAKSDLESEKKAAGWVASLNLGDPAREARVQSVIATHLTTHP